VHVHDPPRKRVEQRRPGDAHVTRQRYQLHIRLLQRLNELLLQFRLQLRFESARSDEFRRDVVLACPFEDERIRNIAKHDDNLSANHAATACFDDRFAIRPVARAEHPDV